MKLTSVSRYAWLALGLISAVPAAATEGGVFGGPIGGSDIRSAYLPPIAGLYGTAIFLASTARSYQDQFGNAAGSNPAYFTGIIEGGALLYVYPINPLGFTIASSFQGNYQEISQSLSPAPHVHLQGNTSGFGDSYVDFLYASKYLGLFGAQPGANSKLHYGLTFGAGIAAEIPIGTYNVQNFVNAGKNTFITIPNIAFTYLTGPNLSLGEGTEISGRLFYEASSQNPTSLYHSGNIIDVDFALTERWSNYQFGIAGAYAKQLNADLSATGGIVAPNGDLYKKLILGPVFAWDIPEIHSTFKVKATFGIHNENTYLNNTIVFTLSRKLL